MTSRPSGVLEQAASDSAATPAQITARNPGKATFLQPCRVLPFPASETQAPWSSRAVECVADGTDGAQQIPAAILVERLAQPPDVHVDRAHLDLGFVSPEAVEQLLARKHSCGIFQKMAQQAKFGRPEMDETSGARH